MISKFCLYSYRVICGTNYMAHVNYLIGSATIVEEAQVSLLWLPDTFFLHWGSCCRFGDQNCGSDWHIQLRIRFYGSGGLPLTLRWFF